MTRSFQYNELVNAILLFAMVNPLYKLAERRAWVTALSEIEKLDNHPYWLATNEPAETNRALLLESITVSVETIELKFK